MTHFNLSTSYLDNIIRYVQSEKEIATYNWKIQAVVKRCFRDLYNYLFGPYQFRSIHEAREILFYYAYRALPEERNEWRNEKMGILFDELSKISSQTKAYTDGIDRAMLERFRKPQPTEECAPAGDGYQFSLVPSNKLPSVTGKLLFHLEADAFGKNSSYEGTSIHEPLAYFLAYIQQRVQQTGRLCDEEQELVQKLKGALRIANSWNKKKTIHSDIEQAFKTNKSILIPGGWVGVPSGHAIYYELIPTSSTKASLRIFNTGAGIQEHDHFQVGAKEKVSYAEWRDIDRDKLLDPHFAQALEEMITCTEIPGSNSAKTEYNFLDIYHGLKTFLGVKNENRINEAMVLNAPLMQPQRSGTCAFRSLLAFIKTKMSQKEYRRFKCDIRIQALVSYTLQHPANSTGGDITQKGQWRLVKKSLRQLSRKITKLYRNRIVGSAYLTQSQKTLDVVERWLETQKNIKPADKLRSCNNPDIVFPDSSGSLLKIVQGKSPSVEQPCTHLYAEVEKYALNNHATFAQELGKIASLIEEAYQRGEYRSIVFSCITLIRRISVSESFWNPFPSTEKELEPIFLHLKKISSLYFKSCYRTSVWGFFPEQSYPMLRLLKIQRRLIAKFLPDFHLNLDVRMSIYVSSFDFQSQDEEIERDMFDVENDNSNRSNRPTLFKYDSFHNSSQNQIATSLRNEPSFQSSFLRERYPDFISTFKWNWNFRRASKKKQEMLMYMSPHLPLWMQCYRDASMQCNFLYSDDKPSSIAPQATLEFSSEFVSKNCSVETSIDGVVKEYRGRKRFYEFSQREITSPLINKVLQETSFNMLGSEKDILVKRGITSIIGSNKNSLRKEDNEKFKELYHPFISISYGFVEMLQYFSRYPDRLQDPDFQQILQKAFFGMRYHRSYFTNNVPFSKRIKCYDFIIKKFIKNHLVHALTQNDLGTAVFLMRFSRYLSHYSGFEDYKDFGLEPLKKLLADKNLSSAERSLLNTELIGWLGEKEHLNNDELIQLLIATIWVSDNPLPEKWREPKQGYEKHKALHKNSLAIEKILNSENGVNQELIRKIYREVKNTPTTAQWTAVHAKGKTPRFKSSEGDIYEPLSGILITLNKLTALILFHKSSTREVLIGS